MFHPVIVAVEAEVTRAVALHGPMRGEHEAYAVLLEEVDEFWDLVKVNQKKLSQVDRLIHRQNMRTELIQIAAMAVRATIDLGLATEFVMPAEATNAILPRVSHSVRPLEHAPIHLGSPGATHKRNEGGTRD